MLMFKGDYSGDMENIESVKTNSLRKKMGNVIAEMIRCHNTDMQTLKDR